MFFFSAGKWLHSKKKAFDCDTDATKKGYNKRKLIRK